MIIKLWKLGAKKHTLQYLRHLVVITVCPHTRWISSATAERQKDARDHTGINSQPSGLHGIGVFGEYQHVMVYHFGYFGGFYL